MNAQFHTPSFGDEVFDLTDIETTTTSNNNVAVIGNTNSNFYQQQQQQQQILLQQQVSKRMRGSMDNSLDEYHTANDDSFVASSPTLSATTTATVAARKQMSPVDPNEPAKPLSAYALFFRDTVSAIKQQNPNCSFQELSRIVASMWDALDPAHKDVYNKKNEVAKSEYFKQMRIFRQQQQQLEQQQQQHLEHSTPLQSKPAVFTIARTNSVDNSSGNSSMHNPSAYAVNNMQPQQQQQQQQQQFTVQNKDTFNNEQQNLQNQEQQNQINQVDSTTNPPAPAQQILTEAGSVQKCIRDNCTKRAIINPDWEDEYCSNECVVIHCRNVFNDWVQSNFDARAG